jgi:Fe-S cluster assembly iron-binding protein IscA
MSQQAEEIPVTLTDAAIELLRRFAGDRPLESLYVLVAVMRYGSKLRYFIDFRNPRDEDIAYTWKGVRLQIDRASAPYLDGTVIDAAENGNLDFTFTQRACPASQASASRT